MLSWNSQKELVYTLWADPIVRSALKDVLKPVYFERPDLGWLVKTVFETQDVQQLTANGLLDLMAVTAAPHILAACGSLVPDVEKSTLMNPVAAIEAGRRFAAFQEARIFAGQLETLAKTGQWGEIRNRMEGLLALSSEAVKDEDDGLVAVQAATVVSEKVEWLWPGFVPYGKVSTMEGNGGTGKSTITIDLISRLSAGRSAPLEPLTALIGNEPTNCIIMSAEDAAADTIVPRLEAAGADLSRVTLVSAYKEKYQGESVERGVALDRDIPRLENLIVKTGARLVVIDPIVAMLGGADFHREQDVRRILKSLAQVAERRRCAILTIRHLNKDKSGEILARGSGSIGFVSAVRVAMLVVKHPVSEDDRVVAVYKTNLSKPPQPVVYRFKPWERDPAIASIEWTQRSNMTLNDLVSPGGTR